MQNRTIIAIAVILFLVAVLLGTAIFVALYVSASQQYTVPVAAKKIPANTEITSAHLRQTSLDSPPNDQVIVDSTEITGRVSAANISSGSKFTSAELRNKFKLYQARESLPAGNRVERGMVRLVETSEKPPNAVDNLEGLENPMLRASIDSGTALTTDHVYTEERQVVVANRQVNPNTLLRSEHLRVESRPGASDNAATSKEDLLGRALRSRRDNGEIIKMNDLYAEDLQLSYFIPLYRRAVGVQVDSERALSYMIRPGDLVDLYVYQPRRYSQEEMAKLQSGSERIHVLQKVAGGAEVLALNRPDKNLWNSSQVEAVEEEGKGKLSYDGLTLAVTLKEAEKVRLIQGMKDRGISMRFFVILRPRSLDSQFGLRNVTDFEVFDRDSKKEMEGIMNSRPVEVIQGGRKETLRVPDKK